MSATDTETQAAFRALLNASAQRIMSRFNFHKAAQQMFTLNFGWVPRAVKEIRKLSDDPALLTHELVRQARHIAEVLLRNAIIEAINQIDNPAWGGSYHSTGGFVVIVRTNGVINLFFSPVDADSYDDPELDELGRQFDTARERARTHKPTHSTVQPVDLTPGKRRLLPVHR